MCTYTQAMHKICVVARDRITFDFCILFWRVVFLAARSCTATPLFTADYVFFKRFVCFVFMKSCNTCANRPVMWMPEYDGSLWASCRREHWVDLSS